MIFISAIIISQWSTEEQNKGHRFHISWSLWNPLFPLVWTCPADLMQKTLQMKAKTQQPRLAHFPHSLLKTEPYSSKSQTSLALVEAQLGSSSREEACFTSFIKQVIHRNNTANFCVTKTTLININSHERLSKNFVFVQMQEPTSS